MVKAATAPDMKQQFDTVGVEVLVQPSPEAFTTFLRNDLARWGKVAKESGARAD
jgi:tripartite-type tricarboxylate transporter receptor subunit TctC